MQASNSSIQHAPKKNRAATAVVINPRPRSEPNQMVWSTDLATGRVTGLLSHGTVRFLVQNYAPAFVARPCGFGIAGMPCAPLYFARETRPVLQDASLPPLTSLYSCDIVQNRNCYLLRTEHRKQIHESQETARAQKSTLQFLQ